MRLNVAHTNPAPALSHSQSASDIYDRIAVTRRARRSDSVIFGVNLSLPRSQSCGYLRPGARALRRSCSASYEEFKEKDFAFCPSKADLLEPALLGIRPEAPDWPARDEVIRDSIARRANCVELPFSLRMLKRKQRLMEGGGDSGGDQETSSSIHKAFASTVFVIRELQSHALRMRGLALDEDMDAIIDNVQREMNSSFVWLFREVFSRTPDLMVNVLTLLTDYSVHSLQIPSTPESLTKEANDQHQHQQQKQKQALESFIGYPNVIPDEEDFQDVNEKELELWNSMVDEAHRMEENELDRGALQQLVSPISVQIEADEYAEYSKTDLVYQINLSQQPNNPLLLSNYAQFLCLVARDYNRAEECFQRAIQLDSSDAEVLSQYATFLWLVRKDLWGAEERYQQAMAAEPENPYHASKYASFLWSTGGDDTCYPLDVSQTKK